jgi:hypothetical protein
MGIQRNASQSEDSEGESVRQNPRRPRDVIVMGDHKGAWGNCGRRRVQSLSIIKRVLETILRQHQTLFTFSIVTTVLSS